MNNRIRQFGFTLTELLVVVMASGVLAGAIFLIYTAFHFISKFW